MKETFDELQVLAHYAAVNDDTEKHAELTKNFVDRLTEVAGEL